MTYTYKCPVCNWTIELNRKVEQRDILTPYCRRCIKERIENDLVRTIRVFVPDHIEVGYHGHNHEYPKK